MNFVENSLWLKILADGEVEYGVDGDIIIGKASWTRGKKNIIAVAYLFEDYNQGFMVLCPPVKEDKFVSVNQLDQMICSVKTGEGKRVKRTFEIETTDYKNLYQFEDFCFKVDLDFLKERNRGKMFSRMMCFQLTTGENEIGEKKIEAEHIIQSNKVLFSICDNGDFIIEPK